MTEGEMLKAIYDALPELLETKRRKDELEARSSRAHEPSRADDMVGVDYVARKTGLSPVTIRQGKAGTDRIVWVRFRPKMTTKREADRVIRELAAGNRSPRQKALKLLERKRA